MTKRRCIHCGEDFTIEDDDAQDANCCQECFDMLEEQIHRFNEDEQRSDADPGL